MKLGKFSFFDVVGILMLWIIACYFLSGCTFHVETDRERYRAAGNFSVGNRR